MNGVFNALYVEDDATGDSIYYGKGAGEMPTGSAVVSDITDIAGSVMNGSNTRTCEFNISGRSDLRIRKMEDIRTGYYLRMSAIDKPGVLSRIAGILGANNISIKSMIQKGRRKERAVPLVMMTHVAQERDMVKALREINRLAIVSGRTMYLRVEGDDE